MPRREDQKRILAARIYLETNNASETARRVGVNRVTIQRWLKEPGFLDVPESEESVREFPDLVPKALQVLSNAIDGEKVTSSQIRAALEVVKASNALKEQTKVEGQVSLADLIAELDAAADAFSD
jgi:predicted site-specific integrase-resolvase